MRHIRHGKAAEALQGGLSHRRVDPKAETTPASSLPSSPAAPQPAVPRGEQGEGHKGLCLSEHGFYHCLIVCSMSTGDKEER